MAYTIPSLANTSLTDMYKNLSKAIADKKKTTTTTPTSTTSKTIPTDKYNFLRTPEQNAQAGITTTPATTPNFSSLFGIPNLNLTKTSTAGVETPMYNELKTTPIGPNTNVVQGTTTQNYYNPYQEQQSQQLDKILNYQPFQFDVNNPALQQAQQQAIDLTRQQMAGRGRVFDTYAQTKEQESAQKLIPDYYQLAMNQYNAERQNAYDQLSALRSMESDAYNRYMGQQELAMQQAGLTGQYQGAPTTQQAQINRANQMEDVALMEAKEIQDFGTTLSPMMRDYRQQFLEIPQDILAQLMPLGNQEGGFATTINQLEATNPNDWRLPYLRIMRANKVLSDPTLLSQYGIEYGMQTGAITDLAKQIGQEEILNQLEILKQQSEYQEYQWQIEKLKYDISKIASEIAYKDAQTVQQELENLKAEIEAYNLPAKLEAELKSVMALTESRVASATSSYASAQRSQVGAQLDAERIASERLAQQSERLSQQSEILSQQLQSEKIAGEKLKNITLRKETEEEAQKDPRLITQLYTDYIQSGKDIKEWLVSPIVVGGENLTDENGVEVMRGDALTETQLRDLLDVVAERDPANKDVIKEVMAGILRDTYIAD